MAQELNEYRGPTYGGPYYDIDEVDAVLAEKDAEIRRLKRALYKACFNWAHFAVAFFAEYRTKEKWRKMENKCLAKAEEYR